MLDFSFSELLVCLLVALIVLGPERLPVAARAVGRWTGKARAYMRNFTAELEREAQISEIKKQLEETQKLLQEQSAVLQQSSQKLLDQTRSLNAAESNSLPSPAPAQPTSPPSPSAADGASHPAPINAEAPAAIHAEKPAPAALPSNVPHEGAHPDDGAPR